MLIDCGDWSLDPTICEVYSPPRVAKMATDLGLGPGWSLDITTQDSQGMAWDFADSACRRKAIALVNQSRPLLLVLSPMCKYFSALQNLSKGFRDEETFQENLKKRLKILTAKR